MNRLNKKGSSFLNYKIEYQKHISETIDEAILIALKTLVDKGNLDIDTLELIKDDNISIEDLRKHLLTKKAYVKSTRQLYGEFEKVRKAINDELRSQGLTLFIETETDVENNRITIMRQYTLSKEFFEAFFGIESEQNLVRLMKKRGFIERFAILRLQTIFKEIYSEMNKDGGLTHGFSMVYFDKERLSFSIDYHYHINVDFASNESNLKTAVGKLKDADGAVTRKFNKKSGLNLYESVKKKIISDAREEENNFDVETISQNKSKTSDTLLIVEEAERRVSENKEKVESTVQSTETVEQKKTENADSDKKDNDNKTKNDSKNKNQKNNHNKENKGNNKKNPNQQNNKSDNHENPTVPQPKFEPAPEAKTDKDTDKVKKIDMDEQNKKEEHIEDAVVGEIDDINIGGDIDLTEVPDDIEISINLDDVAIEDTTESTDEDSDEKVDVEDFDDDDF